MNPIRSLARVANVAFALLAGAAAGAGCSGAAPERADVSSAAPWVDVRRPEDRFTLPVGAVDGRERCTAWHAGSGVMVTARHCLSNAGDASSASVSFDLLANVADPTWHQLAWSDTDTQPLGAPVTLVHVADVPSACLKSAHRLPRQGEPIVVVHQTCDTQQEGATCITKKRLSKGRITLAAGVYMHDALALPASSGAPVMTDDGQFRVLGIHTWGGANRHGIVVPIASFDDRIDASWCP